VRGNNSDDLAQVGTHKASLEGVSDRTGKQRARGRKPTGFEVVRILPSRFFLGPSARGLAASYSREGFWYGSKGLDSPMCRLELFNVKRILIYCSYCSS
jgi:hypothetical protein